MDTNSIPETIGRPVYRYFQEGEYTHWKIQADDNPNDPWAFAKKHKAERVSIMCVSEDLDLAKDRNSVTYSGILFFDIDDPDLKVALHSANQLVAKLLALGVDTTDIEVHLSGKKGVHIYLAQSLFCKEQEVAYLPEIYAKMAMHLWVEGLDFQVYSAGKGRMVRPPYARRPDSRYKIPVSVETLREITLDEYALLTVRVDGQVPEPTPKANKWVPKLAKLFNTCKESVSKPLQSYKPISPADLSKLGAQIPSCVEMLAEGKRRKIKGDSQTSFNALSMQVGCWSKYSMVDKVLLDTLHERIAKNNPSSTGENSHSRVRKLESMHHYLKTQERYTFSCAAIKKLIEGTPECSSCPVFEASKSNYQLSDALYLFEGMGNYYADKDKTQLIGSFTLVRDAIIMDEETHRVKSTTLLVTVPMTGETHKLVNFPEDAWISKTNLKKELSGIDGVSFLGSDNDVARLRNTLTRDDLLNGAEVKQVYEARRIGLNYKRRYGPESPRDPGHKGRLVYVEQGFSINDVGVNNTHVITSDTPPVGAPNMKVRDFHEPMNAKANEALSLMFDTNYRHVVATIFGWFIATHLKSHYYAIEHRFPLLCISGLAGTGKNSTIAVMMRLCGVEGERALITLEAPNATNFPFQEALSNSSTIPRVINEMNPKSVNNAHYRKIIEMLKATFDSQNISRGRLGGGDRGSGTNVSTLHWKITAPVVVLSEEPITEPAVIHRSLMLDLAPGGLTHGREAFQKLEPRADDLVDVGRILIREALTTPIQEVIKLFDSQTLPAKVLNADIPERMKYSYRVILSAYKWAINHLEDSGITEENLNNIREMAAVFEAHISGAAMEIAAEARVTEVDSVISLFALLAHNATNPESTGHSLIKGFHYVVINNELFIDVNISYPMILGYTKVIGQNLGIRNESTFLKLVKSMPYYITDKAITPYLPTGGRTVVSLDMNSMAERGLPVSMFQT